MIPPMNVKPRTMKPLCLILLVVLAFPPEVSSAQSPCVDEGITNQRKRRVASEKCFKFYTACQKIGLRISVRSSHNPKRLPEVDRIKRGVLAAVESRLRSAQIYDPAVLQPILYVPIHVFRYDSGAFGSVITFYFEKLLFDSLSGENRMVEVWTTGSAARNKDGMLSKISQLTDQFLVEFLRVNEKACALRDKEGYRKQGISTVRLLSRVKPPYPAESKSRGEEGVVILRIEVLSTGRVGKVEIAESSGHELLDRAARRSAVAWRFEFRGKKPDRSTLIRVPIEFRLRALQP